MSLEPLFSVVQEHWNIATLGDICARGGGNVQTGPFGSQLHAADYVPIGIPSIMPQNIGDNRVVTDGIARITEADAKRLDRYLVRIGDIVYSRRGDVERRALITENEDGWLCGTGCLRVRFGSFDYVDPRYASYYLGHQAVREWIVRHAIGATMPNLNTSILSSLPFVLPPLPEQRAIADFLGSLDDKIELNRRMNETLEQLARALFKSWFVDFDPVRAKAEGRAPAGMDAETAALFPSAFDGDVPEGWKKVRLSDICTTQYGFTTSASEEPIGPKFLRITDMNKEPWIDWATVPYCSVSDKDFSKYKLELGDVLVSRMADPGKAGIVEEEIDSVFASYLVRLKFQNLAWSYFGFYFLRSDQYLEYTDGAKSGSVQSGMNAKVIVDAKVTVPPEPIVNAFLKAIHPLRQKITTNLQESRTLAELRDTLLPRLMSGEVRVKTEA